MKVVNVDITQITPLEGSFELIALYMTNSQGTTAGTDTNKY
jgi:hypothetical protein